MTRFASDGSAGARPSDGVAETGGGATAVPREEKAPLVDDLVLHDLMGPLSGALGQLQILQMQLSEEKCLSKVDMAYSALAELSEMVGTLQHLTHLERGVLGETAQTVGVQDLLDDVSDAVQPAGATDGAALELREVSARLAVQGFPQLLRQAMCGLVRVGLRLCRGAAVSVGAESTTRGEVRLTVTYEGRPLPDEVIDKLFDEDLERVQREHSLRIDRAHSLMLVASAAQAHEGRAGYEPLPDGGRLWLEVPGA